MKCAGVGAGLRARPSSVSVRVSPCLSVFFHVGPCSFLLQGNSPVRTFVAIEIDDEVKDRIQHLRDRLEDAGADVRWVRREHTHLTLKFIGEIDEARSDEIAQALARAAASVEPFEIRVADVGTFPRRRPTVLWVGVEDESGSLSELHRAVDRALGEQGIEKESRKFTAHITLGRIRSGRNIRKLLDILQAETGMEFGTVNVESLTFFASTLTPDGPIHTPLATAGLGKQDAA